MARIQPTRKQINWLKNNYEEYRNADIAAKFDVTIMTISNWLKRLGLKKTKRVYAGRKSIKRPNYKRKIVEPENKQIRELSREYSNVTREQHVDRILSMNI